MITDSNKRQAGLNLLQRLRRQGLPDREEKMESMFDSITGEADEEDGEEGDEMGARIEVREPSYEEETPEEQEKKRKEREQAKGPKLEPKKVDKFKKGFMSVP